MLLWVGMAVEPLAHAAPHTKSTRHLTSRPPAEWGWGSHSGTLWGRGACTVLVGEVGVKDVVEVEVGSRVTLDVVAWGLAEGHCGWGMKLRTSR